MADEDRLDGLPDALLSIIVSSLPFKEAVRTSTLSKRWGRIWLATKNIELQESFFVRREEPDQQIRDIKRREFIHFATNFIRVHQEPIVRKFSLSFSNPRIGVRFVNECIQFAITHNVETLELDFSNPAWNEDDDNDNHSETMFDLPPIVYQHGNLRSIKLSACNFRMAESMKLIALEHLSLEWMKVGIEELTDLIKNCVMLESLNLKKCWDIADFEVDEKLKDTLKLKSLVIEKCRFDNLSFAFDAPNLTYFKYVGSVGSYKIEVNPCFEEADLEFRVDEEFDSTDDANLLYRLLNNLYPTTVLSVCSYLLQTIPDGDEPMCMEAPMNVRHLSMRTDILPEEFYGILFLLNSCPRLKKLTLLLGQGQFLPEHDPSFPSDMDNFWAKNSGIIKCLAKSLEIVEAKGFTGKHQEVAFLSYLLVSGRRLKSLSIVVDSDDIAANRQIYLERAQFIKNIKAASKNVQIHIS